MTPFQRAMPQLTRPPQWSPARFWLVPLLPDCRTILCDPVPLDLIAEATISAASSADRSGDFDHLVRLRNWARA